MRLYSTLSRDELAEIATETGVCIDTNGNTAPSAGKPISRGRNAGKTLYTFVLRPDRATADADGNCRHQRESVSAFSGGRKVHAVCWHGHADFMTRVYLRDAGARFETGVQTYADRADFAARYLETAGHNIGSLMYPAAMASACRCGFRDMADHATSGQLDNESAIA
jgi:hypothetical protein